MTASIQLDPLSFQRDGFVHIRSVFSSTEVAHLRSTAEAFAERSRALGRNFEPGNDTIVPAGDLTGPFGAGLVFDARILDIARRLLGRQQVVYFGDSGMIVGGNARGFHKDNRCRDNPKDPDWLTPYTLLRMGIYLEDHARFSGGLKVRRGSHMHADVTTGKIVDVPTVAGDVVVWSLRTTHSGHAMRVRGLRWLHLQPRFELRLPAVMAVPEPIRRVGLFATFGIDDHHLAAYIEKHTNLERYPNNYMYQSWRYSNPDPTLVDVARERGCLFLRPTPEWGKFYHSTERNPLGYLPCGAATPDRYEAHGTEAVIRAVGAVVRRLRQPEASSPPG